jgi:methyl-accepting chemotaxis protein
MRKRHHPLRVMRENHPEAQDRNAAKTGALLALAALLVLGGCGGDDEPSASDAYANNVCSSLRTWTSDVQDTVKSLGDQGLAIQEHDLQSAVDDVDGATQSLVDDLQGLGPPDTEDGAQAKQKLDDLGAELNRQIATVQEAIDSGDSVSAVAATVSSALTQAANAARTTWNSLQELDPAGELRDAFENSDECTFLRDELEDSSS